MKARIFQFCLSILVLLLCFNQQSFAQTHGRVVINEYMPWTSNTCGISSEFIELLNFGPGPVNIGCYILTTGVYSITIPANTILKPGEYYMIAGQNFIPGNCANVDSTATGVHAKLNWNTCNCTNQAIPQTGAGLMADNGNTPLVLLDPTLNVIDAVVRSLPGEPTVAVTSSAVNGNCTSKTFNLSTMTIPYEVLGMAPGNQNSYARTLDGDCNWLKQPNQSGNASNNRKGNTTDITYEFDMVSATSCEETGKGSVSIYVKHSNYASIFPMGYTISLDVNNDGIFDFNDQYNTYTDYDPPFIEINDLPVGHFRVTVFSVKGCYLRTFEFNIIPCNPNTLPIRLLYFKNRGAKDNQHQLEWLLQDVQNLQSIVLEKAIDNGKFIPDKIFTNEQARGDKLYTQMVMTTTPFSNYRLKITQKDGRSFYSPVININSVNLVDLVRIGPNPATDKLNLQLQSTQNQRLHFSVFDVKGTTVHGGNFLAHAGENNTTIPLHTLRPGIYYLQINGVVAEKQPISLRFVKH